MVKPLTENKFPTIKDLAAAARSLVENGFGDHPVQIVVIPDSTLQSIAIGSLPSFKEADREKMGDKPALMIEQDGVSFISVTALERTKAGRNKIERH